MYWLLVKIWKNCTFSKLVFRWGRRLVRAVLGSVPPDVRCLQGPPPIWLRRSKGRCRPRGVSSETRCRECLLRGRQKRRRPVKRRGWRCRTIDRTTCRSGDSRLSATSACGWSTCWWRGRRWSDPTRTGPRRWSGRPWRTGSRRVFSHCLSLAQTAPLCVGWRWAARPQ